ncbi:MAG: adenylate/guanylate cyclase domain-containing protein [Gammaproteobacteria bacterium]|nr:adenylate/guanylate cyclase domain-containing protein [Gammaproteobacteria bacterium]
MAHQRIQDAFRRLDGCIARHGGATHEIRGDAIVAEFEKASDALTAALDFQLGNVAGRSTDEDDALCLRIGIAMGEVIVADGTVTGAGVVLAQRLEQLAEGDGVVIGGAACESIPERMPFEFDPLGEQEVKGFERPVRAFRARLADGAALPSPPRSRPAAGPGGRRWRGIAAAVLAATAVLAALAWWQPWRPAQSIPPSASLSHPLPDNPSVAVLPFVDTRRGTDRRLPRRRPRRATHRQPCAGAGTVRDRPRLGIHVQGRAGRGHPRQPGAGGALRGRGRVHPQRARHRPGLPDRRWSVGAGRDRLARGTPGVEVVRPAGYAAPGGAFVAAAADRGEPPRIRWATTEQTISRRTIITCEGRRSTTWRRPRTTSVPGRCSGAPSRSTPISREPTRSWR